MNFPLPCLTAGEYSGHLLSMFDPVLIISIISIYRALVQAHPLYHSIGTQTHRCWTCSFGPKSKHHIRKELNPQVPRKIA
jgi:hypothetical protein